MGTWGPEPLENDDAQMFMIELGTCADPASDIAAALKKVVQNEDEYLEAPLAQTAIAAAHIISMTLTDDVLKEKDPEIPRYETFSVDIKLARQALRRVLGQQSEIIELWQESSKFHLWEDSVKSIIRKLEGIEL